MKRDNESTKVDNNQMILVVGITGGIILLIAIGLIIYFVIGRMRNNKMKKARREETLRKKQQEIEMRNVRRSTNRSRRLQRPATISKPKMSEAAKNNEMTRSSSLRRSKKVEKIAIEKTPSVDHSEKKDVIKNEILDDETTVVSVTSLNRAQMKQLQDKKQSNSFERNKKAKTDDVSRSGSIRSILKKSDSRQIPRYGSLNRNQMMNPAAIRYSGSLRAVRPRGVVPCTVPMRQMGPPRPMFPLGQRRPSLGPHATIGGYMEDIYGPTIGPRYSGYWNRPRDRRPSDFRQVPRYMMSNPSLNPQSSLYLQRMRHPYY